LKAWNPQTPVAQDREYFTLAALEGARFAYVPGYFSVIILEQRTGIGNRFQKASGFQKHLESVP